VWAAYLHGRAGERLAADLGVVGSLAREQLDQVPRVLMEIG
jgi:NAD(P)H-hydrate repair Nnr-like enzyme with NAD(P)H-hydrate dehydratase domain